MVNLVLVAVLILVGILGPARAQEEEVPTPNFWDQRQRLARPDIAQRTRIRFLTSVDYPPFNFLDQGGRLTGFNVDLARMICAELEIVARCQIEARPFAELAPALARGEGEAVIAGLAVTAASRRDFAFTESYFRYPARFVARKTDAPADPAEPAADGRRIGVVRGTAHAAMLSAFFPRAEEVEFADQGAGLDALKRREIDAYYGDGVSLSFWLDSAGAADCCRFAGGPFLSERYLGEGLAIAVARKDGDFVQAFDYAIGQIVAKKGFSELMLRYFPTSAF